MSSNIALIPVREGSERVKSKNFKDFYKGESLLDIKIKQLKNSNIFDHIYVSSDSMLAKEVAQKHGVEFLLRDEQMCQAHIPWSSVVNHIMDTIPGEPTVTWALTTAPLFNRFSEALKIFEEKQKTHDSLIGVLPTKSFFLNEKGRGINFNPGIWHPYSQELDTYYEVTGSIYIGKKTDMKKWNYWFGVNPALFHVKNIEFVDVDTNDDFSIAQKLYEVSQ